MSDQQPKPVPAGQISVAESRAIRARRETAAALRDGSINARVLLTAAELLDASVQDFALVAVARRGLRSFVALDDDGTIWVQPEPAAEVTPE